MVASLTYVKVIGRLGLMVGDGADADESPDIVWCDEGMVTLTPLNTYTKVHGGSAVDWTGGNAVIDAPLDSSGYLTRSGVRRVSVLDLTSSQVNPVVPAGKATHRVTFVGVKAGGTAVSFAPVDVRIAPDTAKAIADPTAAADLGVAVGTVVCNLYDLMPVPTAGGTPIVQGPRGIGIASLAVDGSTLVATLDNGAEVSTDLPAPMVDSDAFIASRAESSGTATNTALNAAFAAVMRPEKYGAVGDGVTDDSPAWQAMLGAIESGGGVGRVVCDPGAVYLVADVDFRGMKDLEIQGNGATIRSRATPTTANILIGAGALSRKVLFRNVVFDDNAAGRPVEDRVMIAHRNWDDLIFEDCRFINCAYHFIAPWGVSSGLQRVTVDGCTFDGATTSLTGSHVYTSSDAVNWLVRGSTFSNAGQPDPNGSQQGIYASSCKSFVMSDCTFINCAKPFDFRDQAKGVLVNNILIVGGPNGAATSGTAEVMCYFSSDVVIQNVAIYNSYKPDVVRVEGGARNVLRNITYRYGANSPVDQNGFRITGPGSKHRVIAPDFVLPAGGAASAVFRMDTGDTTDVEIAGGVVEGANRLFLLNKDQTTVAARVRDISTKGHVETWLKASGGGSGNLPTAQLVFGGTNGWWPYTPTISNVTATVDYARFTMIGRTIRVHVEFTVSGAAGSIITVSLPTAPMLTGHPAGAPFAVGSVVATDASASTVYAGAVAVVYPDARLVFGTTWGGAANPFTWAAGDRVSMALEYEMG